MAKVQKITTFLWFNDQAEEAARFYVSIFKDSHCVGKVNPMNPEVFSRFGGVPFKFHI